MPGIPALGEIVPGSGIGGDLAAVYVNKSDPAKTLIANCAQGSLRVRCRGHALLLLGPATVFSESTGYQPVVPNPPAQPDALTSRVLVEGLPVMLSGLVTDLPEWTGGVLAPPPSLGIGVTLS